jgi:hypothetical protein
MSLEIPFRLRPGVIVSLTGLPKDLTPKEAERLAVFFGEVAFRDRRPPAGANAASTGIPFTRPGDEWAEGRCPSCGFWQCSDCVDATKIEALLALTTEEAPPIV